MSKLTRVFFNRLPEVVARALLGQLLVHEIDGERYVGRIIETEAYLAHGDEAAHGHKGQTVRNQSLFLPTGHAYVHTMRQYSLLDIVTEASGVPSSVLIRAIQPVEGIDPSLIINGPGKVCRAMHITRAQDGMDITAPTATLFVVRSARVPERRVGVSGRIGISRAQEALLRFYVRP